MKNLIEASKNFMLMILCLTAVFSIGLVEIQVIKSVFPWIISTDSVNNFIGFLAVALCCFLIVAMWYYLRLAVRLLQVTRNYYYRYKLFRGA